MLTMRPVSAHSRPLGRIFDGSRVDPKEKLNVSKYRAQKALEEQIKIKNKYTYSYRCMLCSRAGQNLTDCGMILSS